MADIRPFRGLRYNVSIVGDIGKVVCPPYDIISLDAQDALRQRSQYNAVSLELREEKSGEPHNEARYEEAATLFEKWIDEGVLVAESSPAIYVVEEEFTYQGTTSSRTGLTVIVRLEELEKGIVMPHEFTTPGPKADRLALMKAGHANFSPIMSLYRDPDGAVAEILRRVRQDEPTVAATPEGQSKFQVWAVTDTEVVDSISQVMSDKQIFVADGHHRYETALSYREDLQATEGPLAADAAAQFMMMTLISMDDPGLRVLPYHRVLNGLTVSELDALKNELEQAFHVEPIDIPVGSSEGVASAIEETLASQPKTEVVAAVYGPEQGTARLLTLRDDRKPAPDAPSLEKCDMWLLHHNGISPPLGEQREGESIVFVHDAGEAVESVNNGSAQVAFLLRPLPMELFEEVVGKGERLPPKSTYFYPKLATGLVINSLEGELS